MFRLIIRRLSPLLVLGALFALAAPTVASAATLTIPQGHPRLWYSAQGGTPGAARLARARTYVRTHALPINNWDPATRSRDLALRSLLSSNPANGCNEAVSWMRTYDFPSQNDARWSGEQAILVFDWCYPYISAADRTAIINNYNARLSYWNNQDWGGVTMAASNYYWGFLRNSLLWGIASFHHNPSAQGFINHALDIRYRSLAAPPLANGSKFQNWYNAFGVGGAPLEGSSYGGAMIYYPAIAFTAAADYGYDAWNAVPFHRDAIYYMSYAAPSQRSVLYDGATARFEFFPFNEDENFKEGGTAEFNDYGDFLAAFALRNPTARVSRLAKNWMDARALVPSWWIRSELASASITTAMPTLPIDYYADGAQFLYGRGSTAAGAAHFMLQLGSSGDGEAGGGVGHSHNDLGNFQIWRKGRWLTRETAGYVDSVTGWNGAGTVEVREAIAHNAVLFEGRGQIGSRRAWPKVLRLQSEPGFAYAAVDMTNSYRAPATETWLAKRDWPFAEVAIREFVYLRGLESLVVLDRLRSGSDSLDPIYDAEYTGPQMTGSQVRKTFVLHATGQGTSGTTNPFAVGAANATAVVGTQRLDLRTLLPASPRYRVISEGGTVGQYRLEYDVSGAETTYFLNVVGVRDSNQAAVNATLTDAGSAWQLTLSHPTKGSATLVLQKGLTSTGGSVRIGQAAVRSLRSDVQGMLINQNGASWLGTRRMFTGGNLPPELRSTTSSTSAPAAQPSVADAQSGSTAIAEAPPDAAPGIVRLASTLYSWLADGLEWLLGWGEQPFRAALSAIGAETAPADAGRPVVSVDATRNGVEEPSIADAPTTARAVAAPACTQSDGPQAAEYPACAGQNADAQPVAVAAGRESPCRIEPPKRTSTDNGSGTDETQAASVHASCEASSEADAEAARATRRPTPARAVAAA